jgi:hypothetical protein
MTTNPRAIRTSFLASVLALATVTSAAAQQAPHQRPDGLWVCPNDETRIIMNGNWRIACYTDTPGTYRRDANVAPAPKPPPGDLALQNSYKLARAMNDHKAEIGTELKRSMLAMPDAEKARLAEEARAQSMTFEELTVLRTVAPFAGVSATDYDAFRTYLRITH